MSRLMGLYAQHLAGATDMVPLNKDIYRESLNTAASVLARADAIVVGVGSGASSACGYDHYHRIPAFDCRFAPFERAHGFSTLMDGYYHLYASNEDRWGFLAEYLAFMEESPVGDAYADLRAIVEGRDYFVLTTNIDGQVRRAFPANRVWLFQGDAGFLQCSQPCCDELVPAADPIKAMRASKDPDSIAVPPEALPRCNHCGWLMVPWVRDSGFLEGETWRQQKRRYETFVSNALDQKEHVVFLELGVGGMTPGVIEIPFWDMVRRNNNAFYLRINIGKQAEPQQLEGRSITLRADIAQALSDLRSMLVDGDAGPSALQE